MFKEANYAVDKKQKVHRIASVCVLLVWVILAFRFDHLRAVFRALLYYALPMACIWFPDAMSQYKGVLLGRGRYIDKPSSPTFLRWGGWFMLLVVPCLLFLLYYMHMQACVARVCCCE